MRFPKLAVSVCLVIIALAAFPSPGVRVSAQSKKTVVTTRTSSGTSVTLKNYEEIPEGTEPSTPEEAEWWKKVRKTGNDLQKNGGEKTRSKFFQLLAEGLQKRYRIPLKDRQPQVLESGNVVYPELARLVRTHKIVGTVGFVVEYRADGSVGEVKIIKRLKLGLDESVVRAQFQQVFLPAIQNGAFVTAYREAEIRFSDRRN
ncbi:MAG: energy transducer TonB [Pyrinomonadaceae bacterium]